MPDALHIVEPAVAREAIGFVNLDKSVLEIDLDKAIQLRIRRPFDEAWFWTIHFEIGYTDGAVAFKVFASRGVGVGVR